MKPATLQRVHRVRTLQLGLARVEEARQRDALGQEALLRARIDSLVDAVGPTVQVSAATGLAAAAFYRERLQQSAEAAVHRLHAAEQRSAAATEASRTAWRDQTAVEKLLDRARQQATMRDARALSDLPATASKRHDPCG